jgi:tRNA-dihydrouridine synthase B
MKKNFPKLFLAPMAGISDLPFRIICKELGADVLYSEMLSSTGVNFTLQKNIEFVNSCKQDFPLIVQLFGNNPEHFAIATKVIDGLPKIEELGEKMLPRRPEGIDINFGCPVKKVMKQDSGCALMRDPKHAKEIIKAVLDNTSLPVSIKIRAGIDCVNAFDFLEEVAELDWKMVMIHGRTFKGGFSGEIDFKMIKEIKEKYPKKEVIANGGVFTPEIAKEVFEKTSADGLGIARGCFGNPWLFSQIKEYFATGKYSLPSIEEIKSVAIRHCELIEKYKGEKNIIEMRKHLGWYFKGFPDAKKLRAELYTVESLAEIKNILAKI